MLFEESMWSEEEVSGYEDKCLFILFVLSILTQRA